ncbi:MAG: anti-sigma regulatory factor [Thermomicrobiales bacterium]
MVPELPIAIKSEGDIVAARQYAREIAKTLGFGALDQSRIATAVSEITRNVVKYATDSTGEMEVRELVSSDQQHGIEIVVRDGGPGIADIEEALRDGFSTGGSLGMGLSGARRLMDELLIDSIRGEGTTVTMRKWRPLTSRLGGLAKPTPQ